MKKVFSRTQSLCPACRKKVDTRVIEQDNKVYLEKYCTQDGVSHSLICSDAKWYADSLKYIKPATKPDTLSIDTFIDCPDSCGLCPNHRQHTCLPVVEITDQCNLNCPICLKKWKDPIQLTVDNFSRIIDKLYEYEGAIGIINLSGGEPTLHPDLGKFLRIAEEKGVVQVTISTNGLEVLNNQNLRDLIRENNALLALQFDGFLPSTYEKIRGRDLSREKIELISILEKENIKYSIVSTIVNGINDIEIENITDFFFKSSAVSLMFQPAAFTGNAEFLYEQEKRITIPDIIKKIENSAYINHGDFIPLPCSHPGCFALSYYFILDDNSFYSMKDFLGLDDYLNVISNRTLPGFDHAGFDIIRNKIYQFWSASDQFSSNQQILNRIREVILQLNESKFSPKSAFDTGIKYIKAIFIHQFMDVHTLDFSRLTKCCNHYPQIDDRLIPMCAQNIFFSQ